MLSKGFKIVSPKTFEIYYEDITMKEDEALIKVDMGAICKADLRYYLGQRSKRILGLKYPMRLLHEVVGTVLKDPTNTYKIGQKVVLVPNITICSNKCINTCNFDVSLGENYCPDAKFASSNIDGFSCEYISFPISNIVPVEKEVPPEKAVFAELTSVALSAIRRISKLDSESLRTLDDKVIAVWGDGVVGYILTSVLKTLTNSRIINVGKSEHKLEKFPSDRQYITGSKEIKNENIYLAFECVGGKSSQVAINEIIDNLVIGGKVVLTGVAEENIEINTRKILEKGLTITGSTRSSVDDFRQSVNLIQGEEYSGYLEVLIKSVANIRTITDYYNIFEKESLSNDLGKNLLRFNL
ncbi:ribitol-5-phosphate 2-dehydrogenase [Clostridium punense]|uniref:Ribitol-5-phosphate 2-dehydrogenase n=1 Tax=Clostridium punense TaxID=1054297 RepID=A0ABS4K072_9CLOT|nr:MULTISPECIES: alcohol dehydrogenase catalytic domain-containing protein [Clostridium]EQB88374.1 hypothetical protein M918_04330 [Clostridium sp. BL8]MBP2021178.1 ribitol-5-phosphate 2-dehydrogenase [Clostridium punense]